MVELYVKLIINKRRTIEQVPARLLAEVEDKLASYGYGIDGEPLSSDT